MEKRQLFKRFFLALLVGVVFILGVLVGKGELGGGRVGGNVIVGANSVPDYVEKDVGFDLYWDVWKTLQEKHIAGPVHDTQLFYGSLRGMVKALKDDYSQFFPPQEAKEFDSEFEGEFEGIGAELGVKNERLVIIAPLSDTPAERAGLLSGDWIFSIDGVSSDQYSLDEAVRHIRGKKGTVVKIEIVRGKQESKSFEISRDTITIQEVKLEYRATPRGTIIAEVKLSGFNNNAFLELQSAAREISLNNVSGIVFDLRNNPGGLIDQSVAVAGLWVPEGEVVVSEQGKDSEITETLKSDGTMLFASYPTVVLINKGSASASEIVAGALQDYKLATLVGETSFGKGSVQSYSKFPDGSGIKITVAKWLTPKGRAIDKEGIEPDVVVELSEEDFAADRDPQMDKALEILDEVVRKQ